MLFLFRSRNYWIVILFLVLLLLAPLDFVFSIDLPTITSLKATPVSSTQIDLIWTVIGEAVDLYVLYNQEFNKNIYVGTATAFSHTGLTPKTRYNYSVKAHNSVGWSNWTSISGATLYPPEVTPAEIFFSPLLKTVNNGDDFTLNVIIEPNGLNIAGVQACLTFDPSVINIVSITEGNFFKQTGKGTFFTVNKGIDNVAGIAKVILGTILGPYSISTAGVFCTISATAVGKGTTGINFFNTMIGDQTPVQVPQALTMGSVKVNDIIAPAPVTDLMAGNIGPTSLNLNWTAPGDDGNRGTAASYDLRYSLNSIDVSNWDTAIRLSGEPIPSIAGTAQTMTVNGLKPVTFYYFALKTTDKAGNISALSTLVGDRVKTLAETGEASKIFVYPNPYIKGKSVGEGITFVNLPGQSTINIYNLAAELIMTVEHQDRGESREVWDIRNVSSGIYLYVVTSPTGSKKGKIGIVK